MRHVPECIHAVWAPSPGCANGCLVEALRQGIPGQLNIPRNLCMQTQQYEPSVFQTQAIPCSPCWHLMHTLPGEGAQGAR